MEKTPKPTLEHQNVPENHQGLHDFLYSSGDEHGVSQQTPAVSQSNEILDLTSWLTTAEDQKIAGVYAVFNQQRQAQYVGYSRNVGLALRGHVTDNGPQVCAFVRVQAFQFPKRSEMEALRDAWISENGATPPGNEGNGTWAATVGASAAAVMSTAEREAHEAKKLKLRTAMADETLQKEKEAASKAENLKSAVEADDWSALIDGQTKETH
ncbi:MAG: GIY-YIG nuclease family protein [Cyanobacteria bacterium P01_A01_bin.17]